MPVHAYNAHHSHEVFLTEIINTMQLQCPRLSMRHHVLLLQATLSPIIMDVAGCCQSETPHTVALQFGVKALLRF